MGVGIRIRMYRVGFGDFFLLSVPGKGGGQAHVLVDCGVHAHDIGAMPDALAQMKADTGGELALVIMTHRHADHISGFASGKAIFETFKVERVWMSWFEDPKDKTAMRIQAGLAATAQRLQAALTARAAAPGRTEDEVAADEQFGQMAGNILGLAGVASNDVALDVLRGFKTPAGEATPVDYYRAGDTPTLPASLADAGLAAQILGPPTDLNLVAQMDNKAHQYLAGEGDDPGAGGAKALFAHPFVLESYAWPSGEHAPKPLFTDAEVRQHILDNQPDHLAAAAQAADNAINNQSLVVLFTFAGKTMLFCGDAQWGNWANFLFGGPVGAGKAKLTSASQAILGKLDFLKVGHHGSTNATPMDVVAALNADCCAMCSTDPGAYGNPDKGTEVPRTVLLQELGKRIGAANLARSDQVTAGNADQLLGGLQLPARPFAAGPGGKAYIDLEL